MNFSSTLIRGKMRNYISKVQISGQQKTTTLEIARKWETDVANPSGSKTSKDQATSYI
jgi:hypothetical protein